MSNMKVLGIIIAILFGVVALGIFVFSIVRSVKTNKDNKIIKADYAGEAKKQLLLAAIFAAAFSICFIGLRLTIENAIVAMEIVDIIFGGLLCGFALCLGTNYFILHYYGKDIEKKVDKWLFRGVCVCAPVLVASFFLLTNGFAEYWQYPLVNGINFESGWTKPGTHPHLAWYALCILSGAMFVYFLCDHKFYIEYGKHGILESTFLVAFPSGIIGARLFYVIGQWESEFAGHPEKILQIWNGGLTILGGAFMGIVCGIAWFLWRNRKYSIWVAVDIIVPTILIAQAIGRWGNFFNCEVHGLAVDAAGWGWLPTFIFKNAQYGLGNGTFAGADKIFVPLFFIEGILNFLGYFVIAHLFGNKLRKFTQFGDLAAGYFIWYGLVRATLEPLRHQKFIMTDLWSWYWSLVFIAGGALAIIVNHIVRMFIDKKKGINLSANFNKKQTIIASSVVLAFAIIIAVVGVIFMINSDYTLIIGYSNFNMAVLLYVVAVSIILGLAIPTTKFIVCSKEEKKGLNA